MSVDVYLLASYRGWIMEAIPRESALAISQKVKLRFVPSTNREKLNLLNLTSLLRKQRPSKTLYMGHSTYFKHRVRDQSEIRLFITHFDSDFQPSRNQIDNLRKVNVFLVQNSFIKQFLISIGIDSSRIRVVCGAVSNSHFHPIEEKERIKKRVLIVGDCKPRKNPNLIEETIRLNPKIEFLIHGKNWELFTNLLKNPPDNLLLVPFNLEKQAEIMRESSVLLSLANIEGGPFPILESLASGTPVVATKTGFAPDLINNKNGVLLPLNPSTTEISQALNLCLNLKNETWNKDLTFGEYSWERLGSLLFK